MNTPPFLMLATLLFWGWQTGHLLIGAAVGVLLESSRFIKARWSLTQADFNRLWNICTVLFIGVGGFLVINEGTVSFNDFFVNAGRRPEALRQAGKSALTWFQWFPMIFLPFLIGQAFNERDRVGLATFSWWLRRQEAQNPNSKLPREEFNVSYAYFALCLLSTSAATERTSTFYFGVAALIGWALWPLRTKHYSIVAWAAAFIVIVGAGYGGHAGLFRLQKKLEEMNVTWLTRFSAIGFSDKDTRTRMGNIGRLKNSDRIVLRLRTDGSSPPDLLREASFSSYKAATWYNPQAKRDFGNVFAETDDPERWKLLSKELSQRAVTIAQYLRGGKGLLALPTGSAEINQLPAVLLQTNLFGATKVDGAPGLVMFNARYDKGDTYDSRPTAEDERVDDEAEPAIAQVADDLGLAGLPPAEALKRVARFFQEKFEYSQYLSSAHAPNSNETALARFLLHTRSGHCEYFATATVLLLRKAGIPTRYAVGYSVQEGSGKKFVVRDRHAHAWTLVYHSGTWHDFDTTPGSWNAVESSHRSWLQPIKDFFSDAWFQFSKFRWSKTEWRKYFMWAPAPLLVIVLVRFFRGKQWKKVRARREERARALARQGIDSDFYLIEKHFAARGLERRESESWSDWLRRLAEHESSVAQLQPVLRLHQRHRFDPQGLSKDERAQLHREVQSWMRNSAGHS
jgi:protein-glutamine gamma-glutamyltransferase